MWEVERDLHGDIGRQTSIARNKEVSITKNEDGHNWMNLTHRILINLNLNGRLSEVNTNYLSYINLFL